MLAMFWCRMFYKLLYKVIKHIPGLIELYLVITSFVMFAIINSFPEFMQSANFQCFINGIYSMFYFSLGHLANMLIKKSHVFPVNRLLINSVTIVLAIICITLCMGESDMSTFRQHIVYNVLASVTVTYLLYCLCNRIRVNGDRFLSWYGCLSLVVFCIHTVMFRILPIDRVFEILFHTTNHYIVNSFTVIFHICVTILFCKISEKIKVLRYLFYLK